MTVSKFRELRAHLKNANQQSGRLIHSCCYTKQQRILGQNSISTLGQDSFGANNPACKNEVKSSINDIHNSLNTPDIKGFMNTVVALQSLVVGGPAVIEALGAKQMMVGATIGGGFDATGQIFQMQMGWQDSYKPMQTVVSAATGAVAYPLAGSSLVGGAFWGGAANGTNTAVSNNIYGGNDSVSAAVRLGTAFGGLGAFAGGFVPNRLIGTGVSNIIGGIPSFIPLPQDQGSKK